MSVFVFAIEKVNRVMKIKPIKLKMEDLKLVSHLFIQFIDSLSD